ncbi:MAG: hypothetical protein ACJA0N_002543 [Pseudohongiellaceae bacterium]|jgi:hypothetical protein
MNIENLIEQLNNNPETIEFDQVMAVINNNFDYTPTSFTNGPDVVNKAGTNEGSCKIFSFANLIGLSQEKTLTCFGKYYRDDVIQHPEGEDHANIRSFIVNGWEGINFEDDALEERASQT